MFLYQSWYRIEIDQAFPGQIVLLEGFDSLNKQGTIVGKNNSQLHTCKPINFKTEVCFKIALEADIPA